MEELKLILEAVKTLGTEGKDAFIWWLVVEKIVSPAILFTGFAVMIYMARYAILFIIKHMTEGD